jgi:hypothetical protein
VKTKNPIRRGIEEALKSRSGLDAGQAAMAGVVNILELLLHKTGENGGTIALVFPDESADYVRGFVDGSIDALRLALDHIRDIAKQAPHGSGPGNAGSP